MKISHRIEALEKPVELWITVCYYLGIPEGNSYEAKRGLFWWDGEIIIKITNVRETWIHTHFVVDSWEILPEERFKIDMRIEPELRRLGIQYGFHYERKPQAENCTIVLECIPFPNTRDYIKELIDETIKDFPTRKKDEQRNVVTKITVQEEE